MNKIRINLTSAEQEQLAKAVPGAIEKLLHKIKLKLEKQTVADKNSESSEKVYYLDGISNNEESTEGKFFIYLLILKTSANMCLKR